MTFLQNGVFSSRVSWTNQISSIAWRYAVISTTAPLLWSESQWDRISRSIRRTPNRFRSVRSSRLRGPQSMTMAPVPE